MLHPLPLPLSSCLGCIPPLIGLPSLRFYAVGSSLFLLSVCFCLCSLFYRDDVLCWLLLARPFLYAFHAHLRFPVDLVWFRLSCDHGWIRSGSVNVRKQQKQQQQQLPASSSFVRTLFQSLGLLDQTSRIRPLIFPSCSGDSETTPASSAESMPQSVVARTGSPAAAPPAPHLLFLLSVHQSVRDVFVHFETCIDHVYNRREEDVEQEGREHAWRRHCFTANHSEHTLSSSRAHARMPSWN